MIFMHILIIYTCGASKNFCFCCFACSGRSVWRGWAAPARDCSYLDTCRRLNICKFVHYQPEIRWKAPQGGWVGGWAMPVVGVTANNCMPISFSCKRLRQKLLLSTETWFFLHIRFVICCTKVRSFTMGPLRYVFYSQPRTPQQERFCRGHHFFSPPRHECRWRAL